MRRHSAAAPPRLIRASGDRWLFGYADVVTLLFACFASLYAARLSPTVVAAPAAVAEPPALAPVAAVAPREPPVPPRSDVEIALQEVVDAEPTSTVLDLTSSARGLVLSLAEAGSFGAGRAELTSGARQVVLTIAAALRRLPNLVRVEGHTDDVPMHSVLFASNWELSTARATRVVQLLIDEGEIDPLRLSAAGYAQYHPRLPNDTVEARARNRRVDFVILDGDDPTERDAAKPAR